MNIVGPIAEVIDRTIAKKVIGQAIAALGLLSIPVMGPMLAAMFSYLAEACILWMLTETVIGGARLWVMMNVDWNVRDVEEAKVQLQGLLDDPKKYTAEQQAQIEKDFDEAAVNLIRIVNACVLM